MKLQLVISAIVGLLLAIGSFMIAALAIAFQQDEFTTQNALIFTSAPPNDLRDRYAQLGSRAAQQCGKELLSLRYAFYITYFGGATLSRLGGESAIVAGSLTWTFPDNAFAGWIAHELTHAKRWNHPNQLLLSLMRLARMQSYAAYKKRLKREEYAADDGAATCIGAPAMIAALQHSLKWEKLLSSEVATELRERMIRMQHLVREKQQPPVGILP